MADIERKAADMHTANAAVFGRAAREAYDQGKPTGLGATASRLALSQQPHLGT